MATERPDTVAGILEWTADHLDLSDRLMKQVAERLGKDDVEPGNSVQKDLRTIAKVLETNPHIDELLYAYLEAATEKETT